MLTWIAYDTTAEMIGIPLRDIPAAHRAHRRARALSHRQPVRPLRRDDARPLRDRISGLQRRQELDSPTLFAYKPQASTKRPASTRPISRVSTGISGLRRSATGAERHCSAHRGAAARETPTCWRSSAAIRFAQSPPRYVRAVLWQYWFTSMDEKRRTGNWWRREFWALRAGTYADCRWQAFASWNGPTNCRRTIDAEEEANDEPRMRDRIGPEWAGCGHRAGAGGAARRGL